MELHEIHADLGLKKLLLVGGQVSDLDPSSSAAFRRSQDSNFLCSFAMVFWLIWPMVDPPSCGSGLTAQLKFYTFSSRLPGYLSSYTPSGIFPRRNPHPLLKILWERLLKLFTTKGSFRFAQTGGTRTRSGDKCSASALSKRKPFAHSPKENPLTRHESLEDQHSTETRSWLYLASIFSLAQIAARPPAGEGGERV